jgi:hypothetical protein
MGMTSVARETAGRTTSWLHAVQHADGSWSASARLHVPMPGQIDSRGDGRSLETVDHNRIFTTAAVVSALARTHGS